MKRGTATTEGARVLAYHVRDPQRYGVVEFDKRRQSRQSRREAAESEKQLRGARALFLRARRR